MAMSNEQRASKIASRKILKKLRSATMKVYISAADSVASELRTLKKGSPYSSLTKDSKEALEKSLKANSARLRVAMNGVTNTGIDAGVAANAGNYGKYTQSFMTKYTDLDSKILSDTYAKVNSDLVAVQVAKTYGDGLTYSKRIWKSSKLFERDLRNVVAEGLARNRSIEAMAKDLEVYVRTNKKVLAKRFGSIDQSPIKPGETTAEWEKRVRTFKRRISTDIEYNSLRIVRSQVQGAIQDSNIAAQEFTPSVQSFDWTLSPAHVVYSICEDIVAGNPWTYETFIYGTPPHPNCLSYTIFNEIPQKQFISDLKRWSNNPTASGTEYLNDWKGKYYNSVASGNTEENFFNLLVARGNAGATTGSGTLKKVA